MTNRGYWLTAFLLLAFHVATLFWAIHANASVRSEEAILASGVSQYEHLNFDLYRVNPPLPKWIAAYFVKDLLSGRNFFWRRDSNPLSRPEFMVGADFVRHHADYRSLLESARLWHGATFGLIAGIVILLFATEVYGRYSGLLALILYVFSPFVLGNAPTLMSDIPAGAMACASCFFYYKWLNNGSTFSAITAGIILGLAELCKFTLLVFYPLFVVLWITIRFPDWKRLPISELKSVFIKQLGQLAILFGISVFVINCGYLWVGTFTPLGDLQFKSKVLTGIDNIEDDTITGGNRFSGTLAGKIPIPLPADMVQGIDTQRFDFERGLESYLCGIWKDHGWWYYYIYALVLKSPLGTICLYLLAVCVTIFGSGYNTDWRREIVVISPGIAILIFVSTQSGFSVHSRYVIPSMPFLFIWTSKVGRVFDRRYVTGNKLKVATIMVFALTWSLTSSLWAFPHNLAYFNELSCGPKNGAKYLLGSNLDWGQDIYFLKDWLDRHPEVTLNGMACQNSCPVSLAGIPSVPFPPEAFNPQTSKEKESTNNLGPKPGWYALSANYLYSRKQQYHYFLDFEPKALAGYSIHIYSITLSDANQVRSSMGLPELPSDWKPEEKAINP